MGEGEMAFPNLPNTDQILGCCNFHITVAAMVYKCGYSIPCPIPSIERLPLFFTAVVMQRPDQI